MNINLTNLSVNKKVYANRAYRKFNNTNIKYKGDKC